MERIRLLVIDDHAVIRRGLRRYVELIQDVEVVAEAASGAEALALAPMVAPDVILLDLMMPGMNGITTASLLRQILPHAPIIIFTSACSQSSLIDVLRAGVSGVLLKTVEIDELALAIRTVRGGLPYLQPSVAGQLISGAVDPAEAAPHLTGRERQIYDLLADGQSNKQIAARLRISEKTISVHVSNLMGKLGVRSRTQVALMAISAGA
jgi:two-component system, NarL family, response regulator LiaR